MHGEPAARRNLECRGARDEGSRTSESTLLLFPTQQGVLTRLSARMGGRKFHPYDLCANGHIMTNVRLGTKI